MKPTKELLLGILLLLAAATCAGLGYQPYTQQQQLDQKYTQSHANNHVTSSDEDADYMDQHLALGQKYQSWFIAASVTAGIGLVLTLWSLTRKSPARANP